MEFPLEKVNWKVSDALKTSAIQKAIYDFGDDWGCL
ncbi:hypothetical protein B0I63_003519 [Clostridium beijerinckii]|uniref:Uncharacterized protein n=1 Tax=Clostridium beijerinckii TaxID=1520 RepID=A0A9Q5CKL3_CLOBE|nr:hypothetical protein [Clostridium beijerinckii]MBA2902614.1 hypothetical protein [Clostridium beijerinckii]MBA2912409.1 hypothetical protein [Clostridium beijerinckii]MBA9014508.1 hypothetical protein [Clostridium beijerinckii]NRT03067.1 hypothetical protein [Clostridium beijerinckii]